MDKTHPYSRGIFLMLGASVAFAVMAAAAKFCSKSLSAAEIVFVRSLGGSLAVGYLVWKNHTPWLGVRPDILAARGIIGFIALILYFWSLSQLDLGTAVMLNYTAPIFAVLTELLFFRQKSTLTMKITLLLSFLGVYLLSSPQLHTRPLALLGGLLAGGLAGMVHLLIRYSHEDESPLVIILYFTVTSTIGSGLLLFHSGFTAPSAAGWTGLPAGALVAGLAVVTAGSVLGQLGLTYSLRSAPVWVASPFGYLTPVLGLYLGAIFWQEMPTPSGLIGSALIIVCGMVMYRHLA